MATHSLNSFLNHIHIVMVNTTLPANIGSAARAMKTMGISQLTVVNPKHPIDDTAIAHAAGAQDVLNSIKQTQTLTEALADSSLVFATSSRQRSLPWPLFNLEAGANIAIQHHAHQSATLQSSSTAHDHTGDDNDKNNDGHADHPASQPPSAHLPTPKVQTHKPLISIVFGREDRGLTNEELALANYHVTIPANPNYGVLNVASAVQVVCYAFRAQAENHYDNTPNSYHAHNMAVSLRTQWDEPAASHAQMQQLQDKFMDTLTLLDLYDPSNPRNTPKRVQRLMARLQLDTKEYNLLRAALARTLRLGVQSESK